MSLHDYQESVYAWQEFFKPERRVPWYLRWWAKEARPR